MHVKPKQKARQQLHTADTFPKFGLDGEESTSAQVSMNIQQANYDKEIEVEVGDTVVFASLEKPEEEQTIWITQHTTDLSQGVLAQTVPLAQVFLGGVVGDEVVLRVPGQLPKNLVINKIIRPKIS